MVQKYFGDWLKVIDQKSLNKILNFLLVEYSKRSILPEMNNIFKAFKLCKLQDLKVIMLGQDPYPQKGIATGILFGNRKDTPEEQLSPSLKVIRDAAVNLEIPHYCINFDVTLESWAKQGVLMLNSALTVEEGKIGSHIMLWRPFIATLLKNLSEYYTDLVYVLFGKQAQTFTPYITKGYNTIINIEHPAYYARIGKDMSSKLFYEINSTIKSNYNTEIIWYKEV